VVDVAAHNRCDTILWFLEATHHPFEDDLVGKSKDERLKARDCPRLLRNWRNYDSMLRFEAEILDREMKMLEPSTCEKHAG
jgi:hypothetical protein